MVKKFDQGETGNVVPHLFLMRIESIFFLAHVRHRCYHVFESYISK
jgi:hypothetical protein